MLDALLDVVRTTARTDGRQVAESDSRASDIFDETVSLMVVTQSTRACINASDEGADFEILSFADQVTLAQAYYDAYRDAYEVFYVRP